MDENSYWVRSQSRDVRYDVFSTEGGWNCSCPDFTYRRIECKHVVAVRLSLGIREEVKAQQAQVRQIEQIEAKACLACGSSNLMKWGVRHNKAGDIQKFKCRECGRFFTVNIGFERMKHNPRAITAAMQLYFSGESLRNTKRSLELLGVKVDHTTVYAWIKKYVNLMQRYTDNIAPNVSDTWRADELFLKVKGDLKYLYALMDDETRYWIAQEVAETKYTHDVRKLFQSAKEIAGKIPQTFITDGASSFHDAYRKEFLSPYGETPSAVHIRDIRFDGSVHNNKMERLNGEVRDREKTMRGLKRMDTPILKGTQIYHNFIKPHEGLGGKTPAEAAGIKVEGENLWLTLIQNAAKKDSRKED